MTEQGPAFDVVVVGSGVAGLAAAVSCAEAGGGAVRVAVLERTAYEQRGGNTRWTSAYLRLEDVYEVADGFVDDVVAFSGGRTPRAYFQRLVEELPETMEWVQGHGVRFRRLPTYFVTASKPRLQPVGGGEALVEQLLAAAVRLGVTPLYETTAQALRTDDAGSVVGLEVEQSGQQVLLTTSAIVIASGGFEGDVDALSTELGGDAAQLIPVAPSVARNRGEGIAMARAVGARTSGGWGDFHAEPVDPRSEQPEALVMVHPYGVLVDRQGQRFLDEGAATVDESYEQVARTIWRETGGLAYFVSDQQLYDVPGVDRALLTDRKPVVAPTLEALAEQLEVPANALVLTVDQFNAAVLDGPYDATRLDGKGTADLIPPKSNWALRVERPPYVAYPISCAVVFTFGGLDTDVDTRVLDEAGAPLPGLYAAGECTGVYYGKYPGATSVLRGLVFGRIAGRAAAHSLQIGQPVA